VIPPLANPTAPSWKQEQRQATEQQAGEGQNPKETNE